MDIAFGLLRRLWREEAELPFLEDLMNFPPCPVCKDGCLLPFSDERKPFAFWVCSAASCAYTIGRNMTEETYYKGTAAPQEKEKGGKKWIQFDF